MSVDPYESGSKNAPRKKHYYESVNEYDESDVFYDYVEKYEKPKGKRQARKEAPVKRKRQVSELY